MGGITTWGRLSGFPMDTGCAESTSCCTIKGKANGREVYVGERERERERHTLVRLETGIFCSLSKAFQTIDVG